MLLNKCMCRHFTPFVASVDSLLGVEAEATLKCIASHLATKWEGSYSSTYGYMKSRLAITIVRATQRFICGSMVSESQISVTRPQWNNVTVIHLFQ